MRADSRAPELERAIAAALADHPGADAAIEAMQELTEARRAGEFELSMLPDAARLDDMDAMIYGGRMSGAAEEEDTLKAVKNYALTVQEAAVVNGVLDAPDQ